MNELQQLEVLLADQLEVTKERLPDEETANHVDGRIRSLKNKLQLLLGEIEYKRKLCSDMEQLQNEIEQWFSWVASITKEAEEVYSLKGENFIGQLLVSIIFTLVYIQLTDSSLSFTLLRSAFYYVLFYFLYSEFCVDGPFKETRENVQARSSALILYRKSR